MFYEHLIEIINENGTKGMLDDVNVKAYLC